MTPKEEMHWFWATGVLPGTMFDDLDDRRAKLPDRPPRPINWLRLDLKWRGRYQHRTARLYSLKKVN